MGRWINRDPIGYRGGMNLYGYVGGMPTYYEDPFGLEPWLLPWDHNASWHPGTTLRLWFTHTPREHLRGLYTTDTDDLGATTSAALNGAGGSVLENADTAQAVADTMAYVDPTPLSDGLSAGLDYAKGDDEAAKDKLKGAALGPLADAAKAARAFKGLGRQQKACPNSPRKKPTPEQAAEFDDADLYNGAAGGRGAPSAPNNPPHFKGDEKPWRSGATPNSKYTHWTRW